MVLFFKFSFILRQSSIKLLGAYFFFFDTSVPTPFNLTTTIKVIFLSIYVMNDTIYSVSVSPQDNIPRNIVVFLLSYTYLYLFAFAMFNHDGLLGTQFLPCHFSILRMLISRNLHV